MGKRIYPLQGIKYWWAYDIDEVCALYKSQGLHAQTVRSWIKKGLKAIKGTPTLIYGNDLIVFLKKINESSKCKTEFDQMFCMKCKDAKPAFKKQIALEKANQSIRAKAICRDCKSTMNKSYKMDDIPKLKRMFYVVDVLELYDSKAPTLNTHFDAHINQHQNEPSQEDLFQ